MGMQPRHFLPQCKGGKKKKKAYNTCYSQAVTHPSTTQAQHCLTSVIRRELVYSVWYGSRHLLRNLHLFCLYSATLLRVSSGGGGGGPCHLPGLHQWQGRSPHSIPRHLQYLSPLCVCVCAFHYITL